MIGLDHASGGASAEAVGMSERRAPRLAQGHAGYRIGFTKREERGDDYPAKDVQRNLVADHLLAGLDHRPQIQAFGRYGTSALPWYFTLPGVSWKFEHIMLGRAEGRPGVALQFRSAERSWATLRAGLVNMPGRVRRPRTWGVPRVAGLARVTAYDWECGQVVHAPASYVLRASGQRFAGAWLDFSSQICTEVLEATKALGRQLDQSMSRVPVAISVMVGRREPPELAAVFRGLAPDARAEFLGQVCAKAAGRRNVRWEHRRTHRHVSPGGALFVTAVGDVVDPRSGVRPDATAGDA